MSGFSGVTIIDGTTDSIIASHWLSKLPFSILYNPITNTVFCACIAESPWPPQEALVVIDGTSDSVLSDFSILSTVGAYGNFWGIPSHSRKALVLDSLSNTVYLNHYYSSKISVIDGATGIHERTTIPRRSVALQLFPNPAKYHVNIDISLQTSQNTHIEICDIVGRVLDWFDLPHDQSRRFLWDCCDKLGNRLPNGVYFVKAKVGNHSLMDKLVLIR